MRKKTRKIIKPVFSSLSSCVWGVFQMSLCVSLDIGIYTTPSNERVLSYGKVTYSLTWFLYISYHDIYM